MHFNTLIISLAQIIILVGLGYFTLKKNILSKTTLKQLSDLLLTIILPSSIFISGNFPYSKEILEKMVECFIIASLYYVIALVAVFLLFTLKKVEPSTRGPAMTMSVFANTGFIGFPLAIALYGQDGLLYAVIYNLAYNLFLFTIGRSILGGTEKKFDVKEMLLDPLTISSILAILLFLSPIRIPIFPADVFTIVGDMTVPVSMIIIGGWIVDIHWKSVFSRPLSYVVSFLRLLIFPLAMIGAFYVFGIEITTMSATCILLTALPIGSLNIILIQKNNGNVAFANETMLLSMLLSVGTIFLIMTLAGG